MGHYRREPLPRGTMIEFCGDIAEVIRDVGGDSLTVKLDSVEMDWRWEFEGVCCSVVSWPEDQAEGQADASGPGSNSRSSGCTPPSL